jgi:tyrosine-protein phosphatase SIW14
MNSIHSRAVIIARVVAAVLLFSGTQLVAGSRTKIDVPGVSNFGRVNDSLYRGGQPSAAGFSSLQKMGVGIIVNFRDESDKIAAEKQQVEALGMKYVVIPWSGGDYPSDAKVLQFLDVMRTNPQTKVFVHCKRGADRTGTMVAAYRIAVEHKPVKEAVSEMHQFHYAHFFMPQLQRYVKSLPELLKTNALYSSYATPSTPSISPNAAAEAAATAATAVAVPAMP